jgi:hypothetical protein
MLLTCTKSVLLLVACTKSVLLLVACADVNGATAAEELVDCNVAAGAVVEASAVGVVVVPVSVAAPVSHCPLAPQINPSGQHAVIGVVHVGPPLQKSAQIGYEFPAETV